MHQHKREVSEEEHYNYCFALNKKNGREAQRRKVIEELEEMLDAVKADNREMVLDERPDMRTTLTHIDIIYGITDEEKFIGDTYKMRRQQEREGWAL